MKKAKKKNIEIKAPKGEERTEEKILASAHRLFGLRGFEGVTVKDISDDAGVNVALISYHFGDKRGLYRACLERIGNTRLAYAERVLVAANSVEDVKLRLRIFVEEMIASYLQDPHAVMLVHRECDNQTILSEDIFRDIFIAVFDKLKMFLNSAQKNGFLNKSVDVHIAAVVFFGVVIHLTKTDPISEKYFKLSLKSASHRESVINSVIAIFFNGVSATDQPSP